MVIWSGWGIVVPAFLFSALIAGQLTVDAFAGAGAYKGSGLAQDVNLAVAGLLLTALGVWMNRTDTIVLDEQGGDSLRIGGGRHTFFFVRVEWWGLLTIVGAIALAVT